jgi:hypothetical protein
MTERMAWRWIEVDPVTSRVLPSALLQLRRPS